MAKIMLYTSVGCHLCEQALVVLAPVLTAYELELEEVEVANDDELLSRYGMRIPVVRVEGAVTDLGWPFDASGLQDYLKQAL